MTAAARAEQAAQQAGRQAAAEGGASNFQNQRSRVARGVGTKADHEAVTEAEGRRAGRRAAARAAARDIVEVAALLGNDPAATEMGAPIFRMAREWWTEDRETGAVVMTDARSVLADASEAAAAALERGRVAEDVQPRPYQRMSARDMVAVANQASRVAIAAMSRPTMNGRQKAAGMAVSEQYRDTHLPSLGRAEYDALRERMASDVLAAMLERSDRTEQQRAERRYPNRAAAVLAVIGQRERAAADARNRGEVTPRWADVYEQIRRDGRDVTGDTSSYRKLWTAWARNRCADTVRAYLAERNQLTASAASHDRVLASGRRIAAADAHGVDVTDQLTQLFAASSRPLTASESYGLRAEVDGLTHRERAAALGLTLEAAKQRGKNGRIAAARRWGGLAAVARGDGAGLREFSDEVKQAARTVADRELEAAPPVLVRRAAWLTPTARRTPIGAERARSVLAYIGRAMDATYIGSAAQAEQAAAIRRVWDTAQQQRTGRRPNRAAQLAAVRAEVADLAAFAVEVGRATGRTEQAHRTAAAIRAGRLLAADAQRVAPAVAAAVQATPRPWRALTPEEVAQAVRIAPSPRYVPRSSKPQIRFAPFLAERDDDSARAYEQARARYRAACRNNGQTPAI